MVLWLMIFCLTGCNLPAPSAQDQSTPTASAVPALQPSATIALPPTATPVPAQTICTDHACMSGVQFNYLIVTRPLFIDALTPFINWKAEQGFRVGVVTVDWLDQTFEGRHMAERMKTGMHTLRKNAGVVYVLLVGDTAITAWKFNVRDVLASYRLETDWNVPTGFYRRLKEDPARDVLPSDAYFVEDKDWDPNNTGLNPIGNQAIGEGTFDASLYLGRWPVREPAQIEAIFHKTRSAMPAAKVYFSADNTLSDYNKTFCRSDPPFPGEEFSCYIDLMETTREAFFEENAPWLLTESQFTDVTQGDQVRAFKEKFFNYEGVVFFSYHGYHDCWALDGVNCFGMETLKFEAVFPLLVTQSCLISTFYFSGEPSLSEQLILNVTGPAVILEPPNPYMFAKYLRDGASVGEAAWKSASTYVYFPNPISLLGDPSLIALQPPPQ
jgi:hypothetical protein